MDDTTHRRDELPEHEIDDDRTTGGGILSEGGTAVDRGTGTLSGTAQGETGDDDRPDESVEALAAYDRGTTGSIPRGQAGGGLPEAGFLTDEAAKDPDEEDPAIPLRTG